MDQPGSLSPSPHPQPRPVRELADDLVRALNLLTPAQRRALVLAAATRRDATVLRDPASAHAWSCLAALAVSAGTPEPDVIDLRESAQVREPVPVGAPWPAPAPARRQSRRRRDDDLYEIDLGGEGG